jgi:hypothetical protein
VDYTRARTLSEKGGLSGLVLGHLVGSVLSALLSLAVSVSSLGDVDLKKTQLD